MLVLGVVRGEMPLWMRIALPVLVPASGAATLAAMRAMLSPSVFGGLAVLTLTALSIAPWPLLRERTRVRRAGPGELAAIRAAKRARWSRSDSASERAQLESLEADAPLYS